MNALEIIRFCYENYSRNNRCPDCKNDCKNSCKQCLEDIHMDRIKRRYNCNNIIYCYVCRYMLKYMSEFYYLFRNNDELRSLDDYTILSVGCGPCSDLLGIAHYVGSSRPNVSIKYIGVDLNPYWGNVHAVVDSESKRSNLDIKTKFLQKDITEIFNGLGEKTDKLSVNIVTLHYVLSDMVYNAGNIHNFFKDLYNSIISKMPNGSFIVINDINHYKARDYFDVFFRMLCGYGWYTCEKYYFDNNLREPHVYGDKHPSNALALEIPAYLHDYDVWNYCSSSQMLIKKM